MMSTNDTCVTIVPYFKALPGKLNEMKSMCETFVTMTEKEPKCLYYGFSFDGDTMHCREGYVDGDGAIAHLDNVGPTMQELMEISELTRFEIHGPEAEIAKLREPLKELDPTYYVLEWGFRR